MILARVNGRWYRTTAIHVDSEGHAALRVALEETRAGGVARRSEVTVEHATRAAPSEPPPIPVAP